MRGDYQFPALIASIHPAGRQGRTVGTRASTRQLAIQSIPLVVTTRAELLVVLTQAFDLRARREPDALAAD
jgi:hypothetical protein